MPASNAENPTPAQLAEALHRLGRGHALQPGFSTDTVCEDGFLYLATRADDPDSYYAIDAAGQVVTGPGDGRLDPYEPERIGRPE